MKSQGIEKHEYQREANALHRIWQESKLRAGLHIHLDGNALKERMITILRAIIFNLEGVQYNLDLKFKTKFQDQDEECTAITNLLTQIASVGNQLITLVEQTRPNNQPQISHINSEQINFCVTCNNLKEQRKIDDLKMNFSKQYYFQDKYELYTYQLCEATKSKWLLEIPKKKQLNHQLYQDLLAGLVTNDEKSNYQFIDKEKIDQKLYNLKEGLQCRQNTIQLLIQQFEKLKIGLASDLLNEGSKTQVKTNFSVLENLIRKLYETLKAKLQISMIQNKNNSKSIAVQVTPPPNQIMRQYQKIKKKLLSQIQNNKEAFLRQKNQLIQQNDTLRFKIDTLQNLVIERDSQLQNAIMAKINLQADKEFLKRSLNELKAEIAALIAAKSLLKKKFENNFRANPKEHGFLYANKNSAETPENQENGNQKEISSTQNSTRKLRHSTSLDISNIGVFQDRNLLKKTYDQQDNDQEIIVSTNSVIKQDTFSKIKIIKQLNSIEEESSKKIRKSKNLVGTNRSMSLNQPRLSLTRDQNFKGNSMISTANTNNNMNSTGSSFYPKLSIAQEILKEAYLKDCPNGCFETFQAQYPHLFNSLMLKNNRTPEGLPKSQKSISLSTKNILNPIQSQGKEQSSNNKSLVRIKRRTEGIRFSFKRYDTKNSENLINIAQVSSTSSCKMISESKLDQLKKGLKINNNKLNFLQDMALKNQQIQIVSSLSTLMANLHLTKPQLYNVLKTIFTQITKDQTLHMAIKHLIAIHRICPQQYDQKCNHIHSLLVYINEQIQ